MNLENIVKKAFVAGLVLLSSFFLSCEKLGIPMPKKDELKIIYTIQKGDTITDENKTLTTDILVDFDGNKHYGKLHFSGNIDGIYYHTIGDLRPGAFGDFEKEIEGNFSWSNQPVTIPLSNIKFMEMIGIYTIVDDFKKRENDEWSYSYKEKYEEQIDGGGTRRGVRSTGKIDMEYFIMDYVWKISPFTRVIPIYKITSINNKSLTGFISFPNEWRSTELIFDDGFTQKKLDLYSDIRFCGHKEYMGYDSINECCYKTNECSPKNFIKTIKSYNWCVGGTPDFIVKLSFKK